jgi:lambda repressor-like predicted transcriptional regulator
MSIYRNPQTRGLNPYRKEIIKILADREITREDLARMIHEKKSSHVRHVINGTRTTPRIQRKIAEALGVPIWEIFPINMNVAA